MVAFRLNELNDCLWYWALHCSTTRGLLATDHVILNHGQVTWMTPPLLGYRGMVYDTLDKANLFADTMEESFQENSEPYNDEHIEKVERKVHRYLRRNISFSTPPLTSPEEVCNIILGL
ncbi:hypothetical protein TNCV_3765591 [Trichonephila clavipes]|nr:hypothetical protein TNCV_3765591 [Trichonephila clavipes]